MTQRLNANRVSSSSSSSEIYTFTHLPHIYHWQKKKEWMNKCEKKERERMMAAMIRRAAQAASKSLTRSDQSEKEKKSDVRFVCESVCVCVFRTMYRKELKKKKGRKEKKETIYTRQITTLTRVSQVHCDVRTPSPPHIHLHTHWRLLTINKR